MKEVNRLLGCWGGGGGGGVMMMMMDGVGIFGVWGEAVGVNVEGGRRYLV